MESVNKIKKIFEKKIEETDNLTNNRERRVSVSIKDKVQMYEKQIEEMEKWRKNNNLLEISKKFGFSKYLKNVENLENSNKINNNFNVNEIENIFAEIQVLVENYEKELDFYKNKNKNSCQLCDKLSKVIDEKRLLLIEKEDELISLKEESIKIEKKYDDLNNHINSLMNCLTEVSDTKSNFNSFNKEKYQSFNNFHLDCFLDNYSNSLNILNNEKEIPNKNFFPDISIIISESLFKDFLLDSSININSLNKKLLQTNNFLPYLTTCFSNSNDKNTTNTLSIYHEYLQDIIIQIYVSFIKNKREENNFTSWLICEEDINEEITKCTANQIYKFYCNQPNLELEFNIEEYFEKSYENFTNTRSQKDNSENYLKNLKLEIKEIFLIKFSEYNVKVKAEISTLVKLCRNYIHAGKLFHKSQILYDFWKLFHDITTFEQGNNFINNNYTTEIRDFQLIQSKNNINQRICYYQSAEAPDFSDFLIYFIKFKNEKIDNINIHGARIAIQEDDDFILKMPMNVILSSFIIYNDFLQRIKSLSITNTRIEEESLYTLNKLIEFSNSLQNLDLSYNNIEDKGTRIISESLKNNKSIVTLNLGYNKISSNGTFYLSEMLLKNKSIMKLFLSGNSIRDLGLQSLVNILLNNNKSIIHLDLNNNNLKLNDIIVISNLIIKNCQHLQVLNLSNNKFLIDCINTVGLALKANTNLKSLYLTNIGLNEDTTPYFIQHMCDVNLEELYLDENNLGDVGGVQFANVFRCNLKLKTVSLKRTYLNSASLICFSHALEREIGKKNIKFIYLDYNKFDYDSIENLVNIFKQHIIKGNSDFLPKISISGDQLEDISINKLINLDFNNFIIV